MKFKIGDTIEAIEKGRGFEEAKNALKDLKCTYPLDIQAIVDKTLEIRDFEDGIKIVESLQKEFGFIK